MSGGSKRFVISVSGSNRAAAAAVARAKVYGLGWIGTHVSEIEVIAIPISFPPTPNKTIPGFRITIEAAEQRGYGQDLMAATMSRRFPRGTAVRTRSVGYNFAGGARHAMPAGSAGVIKSRIGTNLRVEFPDLPGRTFVYTPHDLERLEGGGS